MKNPKYNTGGTQTACPFNALTHCVESGVVIDKAVCMRPDKDMDREAALRDSLVDEVIRWRQPPNFKGTAKLNAIRSTCRGGMTSMQALRAQLKDGKSPRGVRHVDRTVHRLAHYIADGYATTHSQFT
jgi:hypothetical protein